MSSVAERSWVFSLGSYITGFAGLGGIVAIGLGDGRIVRISAGERRILSETQAHDGAVLSLIAAPDGGGFLSGGDDGRLLRHSLEGAGDGAGTITPLLEMPGRWMEPMAAGAGPDGLVAVGTGRQALILDGRSGAVKRRLEHGSTVAGLAWDPRGKRLAVAHYNGVSLWWAGAESPATLLEHKGAHLAVQVAPDGQWLVSGMQEGALQAWRLADRKPCALSGFPAKIRSMGFTTRGTHLVAPAGEALALWPFAGKQGPIGRDAMELPLAQGPIRQVMPHPDQPVVAVGFASGAVSMVVMDKKGAQQAAVQAAPAVPSPVSALAWVERNRTFVFGREDGSGGVLRSET